MIKEMRSVQSVQIASGLERNYEAMLNFRHDLQELCGELDYLAISDVCEADEIHDDSYEYDRIDAYLMIMHDSNRKSFLVDDHEYPYEYDSRNVDRIPMLLENSRKVR